MKATENNKGEKMHVYEVGYLVVPTVQEDKIAEEVSFIRDLIEKTGGSIISEEFPKLQPLAYTMERSTEAKKSHFDEGYFGWIKFELGVASIADIKNALDKRQSIIRHLIIKTVRENTMYSSKLSSPSAKDGEKLEGETPAEGVLVEDKAQARKEIDKSIDALVIG